MPAIERCGCIVETQRRNERLARNLDAGRSPLSDEVVATLRGFAEANLDVPGPRVLQLLAELDRLRAIEQAALAYVDAPLDPLRVEALVHALRPGARS